ncbi:hypothetical protein Tco_1132953, partial [Tanacetum coccineum]
KEKQELLAEENAANPSEPSPVSYFYNADYDSISTPSTTYTNHLTKSATIITNPSELTRRIYHNHNIFGDGDDDEEHFPDEVKSPVYELTTQSERREERRREREERREEREILEIVCRRSGAFVGHKVHVLIVFADGVGVLPRFCVCLRRVRIVERARAENERPIVMVAKHRTVRSSGELSASVEREFVRDASSCVMVEIRGLISLVVRIMLMPNVNSHEAC